LRGFIDPIPIAACDLLEVAAFDEGVDRILSGRAGHAENLLGVRGRYDWGREQMFCQSNYGVWPSFVKQSVAHFALKLYEPNGTFLSIPRLDRYTSQEEGDPRHQVTALTREKEVVVVLAAILFKKGR
jgi:hypothetical protein